MTNFSIFQFFKSSLILGVFYLSACQPTETPNDGSMFSTTPTAFRLQPDKVLVEASGLVESVKQPSLLWSHEDAGSLNEIFLLTNQGKILNRYALPVNNYDWEDLAIGPGPMSGETYLYLADIGANDNNRGERTIYRFAEPKDVTVTTKLENIDAIRFKFPDGGFDSETILLDPLTKDIFIVTKFLAKAKIYRLAYPQTINKIVDAEKIGEMTVGFDLTGGAVSTDGKEIIVRAYSGIYYWKRVGNESIGQAIQRSPDKQLPYTLEPQGEAVCFETAGKGYFTLSEIGKAEFVNLYYYERK